MRRSAEAHRLLPPARGGHLLAAELPAERVVVAHRGARQRWWVLGTARVLRLTREGSLGLRALDGGPALLVVLLADARLAVERPARRAAVARMTSSSQDEKGARLADIEHRTRGKRPHGGA